MRGAARVAGLSAALLRAGKARLCALASLVALSFVVLMILSELARVSTLGLDEAIAADVGRPGTYDVHLQVGRGDSAEELVAALAPALRPLATDPLVLVRRFGPLRSDCPPLDVLGELDVVSVQLLDGRAAPLPYGQGMPPDTDLCVGGVAVPDEAVFVPSGPLLQTWGAGAYVTPAYANLAAQVLPGGPRVNMRVVTGRTDQRDEIQHAVEGVLGQASARAGIAVDQLVTTARVDSAGELDRASRGIAAVYRTLGWAVVLLAGLALLVAQTIRMQQRLWFFGLARAVGARARDVAVVVLVETGAVLVLGTVLAVVVALLLAPAVSAFSRSSFGVEAHLLTASNLPSLLLGAAAMLALAAAYPVALAVRQDPLELLEGGHST